MSPPEPSPSDNSTAPQATTDDLLTHPIPTQAASEITDQTHPPQSNINGATSATQPTPTHDNIENNSAAQSSPPQDVAEGASATDNPSPVTDSSTVDPAVRFSQCKDQGNSLVKQVLVSHLTTETTLLMCFRCSMARASKWKNIL